MIVISRLGAQSVSFVQSTLYLGSVVGAALLAAVRPRTWRSPIRAVFVKQVLFTGVEGLGIIITIALLIGLVVVAQTNAWFRDMGGSSLDSIIVTSILLREAAPLLVNFTVISRSGPAITAELGAMQLSGDVKALSAQGIDPFYYLLVPRVAAVALSVCCLTVLFLGAAFLSCYVYQIVEGATGFDPRGFIEMMLGGYEVSDVFLLIAKTVLPALATAGICVSEGMSVAGERNEIPRAAARAVIRSIAALFFVYAVFSMV